MRKSFILSCIICLLITSCIDKGNFEFTDNEEITKETFFDFSTSSNIGIQISYGVNYSFLVEFYSENPYTEDGINENIKPFYSTMTDSQGKIISSVQIPSNIKKVWLVPIWITLNYPNEVNITNGNLIFDYTSSTYARSSNKTGSRALSSSETFMGLASNYNTLGSWDENGVPKYLISSENTVTFPEAFIEKCSTFANMTDKSAFRPLELYPELNNKANNDFTISSESELYVQFLKSTAGWADAIAYYSYKDGENIDLNNIVTTIIYPRCQKQTAFTDYDKIKNSQVQLKYWNPETQAYQNTFPANSKIGFVTLTRYTWEATSVGKYHYSNSYLNMGNVQQTIMWSDPNNMHCAMLCFEDNTDSRFNDVLVCITTNKTSSTIKNIPVYYSLNEEQTYSYESKGTLAFEDNWPQKGDYDVNDLVINYASTLTSNKSDRDKIIKTETTFTAVNNGATYTNGFGFSLDGVSFSEIKSLKVEEDGTEVSTTWEVGNATPTIILFNDVKQALTKEIKVTIEYYKGLSNKNSAESAIKAVAPFNSFIFVGNRSKEIHITGYKPTSMNNDALRGTEQDIRADKNGVEMYYVANNNMPFALHISGTFWKYPKEKQNITEAYPYFSSWASSMGQEHSDWYE